MFNPAGAIVQAVIMIYSVVTFIIERAAQIMALVEAIINSVQAIAQGAIGGAANWIEQALGRLVPVAIGLLASLIGLGGLGAKIRELVTKAGDLVWGAIRKFFKKAIDFVKKMWGKLTGKKDAKPDDRTEAQKAADLDRAISEGNQLLKDDRLTLSMVTSRLAQIKSRFKLTSLEVIRVSKEKKSEHDRLKAEINPVREGAEIVRDLEDDGFVIVIKARLGPRKRRRGFERKQPSAREYGGKVSPTMERAHAAGAGLGREFEEAIRLAPRYVNQALQNRGIERFLRALVRKVQSDPNITLSQKLVVKTYSGTLRLQSITYKIIAEIKGKERVVMQAAIDISNDPISPTATGNINSVGPEFTPLLISVAEEVFDRRLAQMDL